MLLVVLVILYCSTLILQRVNAVFSYLAVAGTGPSQDSDRVPPKDAMLDVG